eukprot:6203848-Pleurochrysis_carterae.AAC.2
MRTTVSQQLSALSSPLCVQGPRRDKMTADYSSWWDGLGTSGDRWLVLRPITGTANLRGRLDLL